MPARNELQQRLIANDLSSIVNSKKQQNRWPTTQVTLLERIQNPTDALSWERFVETYAPLIIKYCRRRGLQDSDARDVAQDVLVQVSKGIENFRYDPDRGKFRNWLGTVTHRAMLKLLARSERANTEVPGYGSAASFDEVHPSFSEDWMELFTAHIYRTAIDRIRPEFDAETWKAFDATFASGQSADITAEQMDRSIGWVYQAKSRVLRRLKGEILFLAEDSALINLSGFRGGELKD
jgi:RNA polymerase sigma factor (sigma-70 family)